MSKGYRLCDSTSVTSWKGHNYRDRKSISGLQGLGEGGVNTWTTEDFQGGETTLCDAVMVDLCLYICPNP